MDFVLRDAYMSGYNTRAFDLSRLIHYSFFTRHGLTIHDRGLPTLINFIETRANLFRTIYFHRTVRALDLALEEVFDETMQILFPGNPLEQLDKYRGFTESSFLVDVQRWPGSADLQQRELGQRWEAILTRSHAWKMTCERTMNFHSATAENTSIFSEPKVVERRLREKLPVTCNDIPIKVDVARHYHRPSGRLPAHGQNYLLDPSNGLPQELDDDELFRSLPTSFVILRVYSTDHRHDSQLAAALNSLLGDVGDSKTNM
jgi:HD superfamily phosphohydrolase